MAWNCTTVETSKLIEEGNGGSAPAKNTTSPPSWQEDSAIPVQLVFPSSVTLYTFRWLRRCQEVSFSAMNCTPWTLPQWYAKLCIGKNGRSRTGWPPDEKVILKVTSILTPHRKKEQGLLAGEHSTGSWCFQKGLKTAFLHFKRMSVYMYPLSAMQIIIFQRQQAQHTADNRIQTTVNRYMPDLAAFQVSAIDICLDYELMSTSL